jgi:hypothetical protein
MIQASLADRQAAQLPGGTRFTRTCAQVTALAAAQIGMSRASELAKMISYGVSRKQHAL